MSRSGSQAKTLEALLGVLRPHWRRDLNLPARIELLLRRDRRFGSRDRRLYRELIYAALRYLPWIEPLLETEPAEAIGRIGWLAAETPATSLFRRDVAGSRPPCPAGLAAKAAALGAEAGAVFPRWFPSECPAADDPAQRDALLERAPLWLRLQTGGVPDAVFAEFLSRGWTWSRCEVWPDAVRLTTEADVTSTEAYARGWIEIQDIGSQLVLAAADVEAGGRWLDACAGAGGKTLALASLLGPAGRVDASDVRERALEELDARSRRAGFGRRIAIVRHPDGHAPTRYDGVLVDAPCSGSGTWRRSPHLKWMTPEARLRDAAGLQAEILARQAPRVRPGGRLIYATCSLCRRENEGVIEGFLRSQADFRLVPPVERWIRRTVGGAANSGGGPIPTGLYLKPADFDGDGFFVASLRRDG